MSIIKKEKFTKGDLVVLNNDILEQDGHTLKVYEVSSVTLINVSYNQRNGQDGLTGPATGSKVVESKFLYILHDRETNTTIQRYEEELKGLQGIKLYFNNVDLKKDVSGDNFSKLLQIDPENKIPKQVFNPARIVTNIYDLVGEESSVYVKGEVKYWLQVEPMLNRFYIHNNGIETIDVFTDEVFRDKNLAEKATIALQKSGFNLRIISKSFY